METITLSGIIKIKDPYTFRSIKLVQPNGYEIDLVNRLKEADESYPNRVVQLHYWISKGNKFYSEIPESEKKQLCGMITARYEEILVDANDGYSIYSTKIIVGGYDLYNKIAKKEGKFIQIELRFIKY